MTSSDQATKINAGSEPPRSRNFSEFGTPLTCHYTIVCIWIAKLLSALLFYHYLLGSFQLCCAWLLWLQHWFMAINLHHDASSDSGHGRTEESAFSWNYFSSWRRFNRDSNSAALRCFHFWSFRISHFVFLPKVAMDLISWYFSGLSYLLWVEFLVPTSGLAIYKGSKP